MKKIYSFMLMATMLLIGINANAAYADAAALQAALNEANNGAIITLDNDLQMSTTIKLYLFDSNQEGIKSVTLDLAGHTISFNGSGAAVDMFHLYRGKLTVKNGVITHAGSTSGSPLIFKVFGTGDQVAAGSYTHLTINEDVQLYVSGGNYKGYGISINERGAITDNTFLPSTLPSTTVNDVVVLANGIRLDVHGYIEMMSAKGYCVKVNGSIKYAPQYFTSASLIDHEPTSADTTAWVGYAPHVYLHSTAHLVANASSTGVGAIYAAGYGVWDIRCEAEGSCALAAKSGEINVVDAVLKSTADEFHHPVGKTSGIETQGTAVLIESNTSYAGNINITFAGDTRVEAESGCAIEEAVTRGDNTKVSAITITGGTFQGGTNPEAASIVISNTTQQQQAPITIGGGSYLDMTEAQQTATDNLITQLISGTSTYTALISTGSTTGTGAAIVISSGTAPAPVDDPDDFDVNKLYTLNSTSVDPEDWNDIDLSNLPDGTVFTLVKDDDHGDLTLGDVMMNGVDKTVTPNVVKSLTIIVENGVTFTVNKLIMNDKARIIVKAGGKLIVSGEQGIVAPTVDNIHIEAQEGNMGLFLFNPAVSSNRHPHGTVELISKAHKVGNTYISQRFGTPSYGGLKIADIKKIAPSYTTYYYYYDMTEDNWVNITSAQYEFQPFTGYAMNSVASTAGSKYEFPCESLFGNDDAHLTILEGWNYIANSYTGEINILALLARFMQTNTLEAGIWFHLAGETNRWQEVSAADILDSDVNFEISKVAPMMGLVAHSTPYLQESVKDTIDYASMVWQHRGEPNDPIVATNQAPAPARRSNVSDYSKAIIVIANGNNEQQVTLRQSSQYSNEFDNGADVSKFKAGEVSLYANTENGEQSQVATDNLMGQTLSIESTKAATFKMTFKNLRGETLAIRDNMTGSVINMTEGEEYFFSVAPGTTADRFEIVEAAKMPTDVEMLEAAPAKKGIYTLVGQYLGENFDVLPAGIYVVNGKKVVK